MKNIQNDFNRKKLLALLVMVLCGFFRVINRSIMMMPVMIVATLAIAFYFFPEQVLSDAINTWDSVTINEKITLAKNILKCAFMLSFAACFMEALFAYPRYPVANFQSAKGEHKL
ncbi:hypothetical protein EFH81_24910 [Salmonella enterica]|nr:hypothetical protein [Salmonella enterica]